VEKTAGEVSVFGLTPMRDRKRINARVGVVFQDNNLDEELNALEIAQAYQRLIEDHGYAQHELADKVGKDRSSVTNYLRLLKLPQEIQDRLVDGDISMGHARALLALEEPATQLFCCRQVIDRGLSVRHTEALVNRLKKKAPRAQRSLADPDLHALQEEMLKLLGTKVLVTGSRNKGVVKIFYFSLDDLNRIYDRIKGANA
jgi:ParB family chromosome partitioning protein